MRRIFGGEVIAGEKVKRRAVKHRFGDSETRESSVTMRNISANPDEKRKCRRRFSLAIELLVYENSRKYRP